MPTPEPLAPDTLVHDRYRIVRLIGRGGMGAIYQAVDQRLGNTVALKQTLIEGAQFARAFEREARILAGLRHPALPVVSDYFSAGDGQFLVMQFIPGEDFGTLLDQRDAPFPVEDVLRWADQLLDALDYLHTQQPPIVHRDIKPQNMKLTPRGEIILLDFGLAKGTAPQPSASATASFIAYTPQYAPLEQIQGAGTDPRSDLYALAATLYSLLTKSPPPNALDRASATLTRQPDPLRPPHEWRPEISPAISAVLMRALALNPDDRYPSASALRAALHEARQAAPGSFQAARLANTGPTIAAGPPPQTPQGGTSPWRVFGCIGALALLFIAVLAIGITALSTVLVGPQIEVPTPVVVSEVIQTTISFPPQVTVLVEFPTPIVEVDFPTTIVEVDFPTSESEPTEESDPEEPTPTPAGIASSVLTFGSEGTGQGFFTDARGIGVDSQGNIYVSEYSTGRIQRFDSQGKFLKQWIAEGDTPLLDLAVDRVGNVYAVRDGVILKYDGASGELLERLSDSQSRFTDVTTMPDDGLLAFSWLNRDDLVRFDAEGAVTDRIPEPIAGQSEQPELSGRVAVDGLGNIFVLGEFNNAVFRFSADGKFVNRFGAQGNQPGQFTAPGAITVDNQSRVYVSDFSGIQIFDADGRYIDQIEGGGIRDMVFDAENNLFVVTIDQEVVKYTLNTPE